MLSGHGDLTRLGLPLESLLQTWYLIWVGKIWVWQMLAEYFCEVCIRFRSLEASTIFLSQYVLGRNFSKAIHEPPGSSESYKSLVNIIIIIRLRACLSSVSAVVLIVPKSRVPLPGRRPQTFPPSSPR